MIFIDTRTKTESAIRGLVGEQPQGERIYRTIAETATRFREGDSVAKENRQRGWNKERFHRQLEQSAKSNGTWVDSIKSLAEMPLKSGFENEAYLSKDGKNVIKVNNLALLDEDNTGEHTIDFNSFLDRLKSQLAKQFFTYRSVICLIFISRINEHKTLLELFRQPTAKVN